ncbi:MAG: methyltransferase [Rhodospirillaceae bacterium]
MTILDDAGRSAFIIQHTTVSAAPLVSELVLHLATEVTPLWQATEDKLDLVGLPPPYWAFPWVGGQAVARYILDYPEIVRGRSVLDFAAGCGLIGLAAARVGAGSVTASDIDPFALAAIKLNAARNGLTLTICDENLVGQKLPSLDVVLAGDVCYERPMAEAVIAWLRALAGAGKIVIIGDPGRNYLPRTGLTALARYDVATICDVENSDRKSTTVWRVEAGF